MSLSAENKLRFSSFVRQFGIAFEDDFILPTGKRNLLRHSVPDTRRQRYTKETHFETESGDAVSAHKK